jgi:serine/threonine-protein kinase
MVHLADSRKSITGIKGTLHYMAPEQIEMKDVTPATDIFSLGVVAYEALTSRKPFDRGSEAATVQAIRKEFPPPASDLNPNVSKALAQVVAKALAKGPWNRFESAREFGEHLQRALRREPIELFDVARIQPRIERARRALIESDFEYANEILNELQLEGHVDAEISLLLEQVNEATRGKVIRQLLDSARTRMQEEEYPLAWQKIQEALQKDPGNREAQALQAEIETRRSDQQMDKWRRLVLQHLHNHAFTQAREAIEEIRKIKPDDVEVGDLTAEVLRRETEFRRVCDEKEREFQSAMRSYGSGEISTALSKLKKILELETGTPGFIVPGRDEVYRETYNKIRSERDEVLNAIAEIEKNIASGNIARAAELSSEQSAKYPNDFALQALKLKVEDLQRQGKSAYIAEIGRCVDAEPDLDRGVKCLEEALERYPNEPHFQELAASLRKRRDLVNSIVLKARQYEEQNLVIEALSQWNTLCSVYPQYPGLNFEIERVQRRGEQRRRDESKLSWVDRIDRLLQTGEHDRAHDLSVEALSEFPGDQELQSLKRLALEGRERSAEAMKLMEQAQGLTSNGEFSEAIELLRRAVNLDPNQATVREALANGLVRQAQALLSNDWRAAEPLIQEALRVSPAHLGQKLAAIGVTCETHGVCGSVRRASARASDGGRRRRSSG